MKYLPFLFVLCFFVSCGPSPRKPRASRDISRPESVPFKSKYENAVEFWDDMVPDRRELKGDSLFFLVTGYGMSILVLDDYVVFHESEFSQQTLHVRTMDKGELIAQFQHKGRGPYEVLYGKEILYSPSRNSFSYTDQQQAKILEYDVEPFLREMDERRNIPLVGSLEEKTILPSRVFNIDKSGIYRGQLAGDKIIAKLWNSGDTPLGVFDPAEGKTVKRFGTYPENAGVGEIYYSQVYQAQLVVSADNSRVALLYQDTDLLEIYDVATGERIARRHGPDGFGLHYAASSKAVGGGMILSAHPTEEARRAYFVAIERGGLIWASYGGFFYGTGLSAPIRYVIAFDWEGNPKMMFKLDRDISAFDVDPERRVIYGVCEEPATGDRYLCAYKY